jgi:hypothetical protein
MYGKERDVLDMLAARNASAALRTAALAPSIPLLDLQHETATSSSAQRAASSRAQHKRPPLAATACGPPHAALRPPTRPPTQVEDLMVASPATVSRCGMVYMEPTALGLEPLFASWLARLPSCAAAHHELLGGLLQALVPPCLSYVSRRLAGCWLLAAGCRLRLCTSVRHLCAICMSVIRHQPAMRVQATQAGCHTAADSPAQSSQGSMVRGHAAPSRAAPRRRCR